MTSLPRLPASIESELPLRRQLSVTRDGGRATLHFLESGPAADRTAALFLHDARSWAYTWRLTLPLCDPDLHTIALDLPGFGLSDPPARSDALARWGDAVTAFARCRGLDRLVLVGHGEGGLVAAAAALATPELVIGAVLVNCDVLGAATERRRFLNAFSRLPGLRDRLYLLTGRPPLRLAALQSRRSGFDAAVERAYAFPTRRRSQRRAALALARLGVAGAERPAIREWALSFPGPLDLVWGHRDPLMAPGSFAEQEATLRHSHIFRSEAGHFVQEEEPGLVAEATAGAVRAAIDPTVETMPPEMFLGGVGEGDFHAVGEEHLRHLIELAGLAADETVLDIGCGLGRTALALRRHLGPAGRYEGFDVVRDAVRWCQRNIARVDPRFRFRHVALANLEYSPSGGLDAAAFRFPYADASFTCVTALSVFTHMRRSEVESYLAEIRRVLVPRGRALLSLFLIDQATRAAMARRATDRTFEHRFAGGWIADPERPLLAIAFDHEVFLAALADAGLELARPVSIGRWRGGATDHGYQDQVVVSPRR